MLEAGNNATRYLLLGQKIPKGATRKSKTASRESHGHGAKSSIDDLN